MLDWNDLRYFLAVVSLGSTIAAAKQLGVNQSTVHRRIAELERRLGLVLFNRHSSGYRITADGETLLPAARRVAEAMAELERLAAAASSGLEGPLRVTCPEPLMMRLTASSLIRKFEQRYPAIKVQFIMSDTYLDLAGGEADVAIRAGDPVDSDLLCRKLSVSPWAIFASKAYCSAHGRPNGLNDLEGHRFIGFDGGLARHRAARWLAANVAESAIVARSTTIPGLVYAAKSGLGLATLPVALGRGEDDLEMVLEPVPELETNWYLFVHPSLRHAPRTAALFDFLMENIETLRPILLGER